MSKGQLAMAVLEMAGLGYGKGKSQLRDFVDDDPETAENRLSRARVVLQHAPTLVDLVIAGQLGVDQATVSRWVMHFGEAPECIDAPALPDAAT